MADVIFENVWAADNLMSEQKTYDSWSIKDIHRYLNAEMPLEESSQFEKAMRSDMFLKDAVDGYAGHSRIYIDHHLDRLNQEFGEGKGRRILPIWSIGAAAAALLLAVVTWFILKPVYSGQMLAEKEQFEVEKGLEKLDRQLDNAATIPETGDESIVSLGSDTPAQQENVSIQTKPPAARPQPRRRTTIPKKKALSGGIVSGIVTDMEDQPLIGASVYFPNNDAAITTDFNGKFAVDLRAYDSVAIVSYTGYDSDVFRIRENANQAFQLVEGIALEEVAVTSTGVEAKQEPASEQDQVQETEVADLLMDAISSQRTKSNAIIEASPEKGYRKYDRYIKRNLRYPALARANKTEGEVVVQFKVLPSGELFDFRILQSVGSGCDEEAIRLIKDGPAWVVDGTDQVGQATYTVEFEL